MTQDRDLDILGERQDPHNTAADPAGRASPQLTAALTLHPTRSQTR
jgi:hypothetical protein